MRRSNGGALEIDDEEWVLHPVRDDSDRKRLARSSNDVVTETLAARQWKGFPDSAVAIGMNGSGDVLVLLADGAKQFGEAVFIWEHETGDTRKIASNLMALPSAS